MSKVEYNVLIYDISEKIEETNLKLLKFVCRDHLGRNGPSKPITTVLELLLELENQNHLGIDRLDLLKEILTHLKKQKRSLLKKVDDFEVRRKAQSIGVISRLNRAADSLVGGIKLLCNFKTIGGIVLGVNVALVLRSCTTLEQFFEAFERVVLPALVKGKELFGGSLCFVVQAETASALKELWNLYKDGTLKNRLQEFLVTKEVQDLAGRDKVEVTVFIDEHEWREAYVNMLFHQNQGDAVKGEQVGERRRRKSDSFLFLKSKEIHMTKMKLKQSENKWNFERQLLQQENEKLQMSNKQMEEGDEIAPELPSEVEKELNLETGKEVVTEPLYQAKHSSKISPPSISSKVDPFRTDPRDESSLSHMMSSEAEPVLSSSDPNLRRREIERARRFPEVWEGERKEKEKEKEKRKRWNLRLERARRLAEVREGERKEKEKEKRKRWDLLPFGRRLVELSSFSYMMPSERKPVLSSSDPDLRTLELERGLEELSPPSISSKVDPFRTYPRHESSLFDTGLYEPELSVPFLGRREMEKATTFSKIRSGSISSEDELIRIDERSTSISFKVDPIRIRPRDESWYFGKIDQWSAEDILKDQNPGRFLVRGNPPFMKSYVVSWRDTDGYRHQEIEGFPDGMFVLRGEENLRFSSLEAAVLHFIAGSTNDMAMVPLLKEKGKIPPYERFLATSTYRSHPTLHLSVETGDTHEIETLLSSGVGIDSRDMNGRTPLMLAAERGRENTFRLLVERGSDPTLKDSGGRSVLHCAARGGSNEIIQELLSRGLDIDSRDNDGRTPLMEVVYFGGDNAVRLLIERGSDPTLRDNKGRSLLHTAAQYGRYKIIQELLSRGLDIDSRDGNGDTPVIMAAIYGKEDAFTLLLERGSDPKQKDAKGRGLLHWAARFGRDVLIEKLLSLGLDINSRENYGDTPLMVAAYRGGEDASSLLIERGSDPTLTDNRGQSALHWAARGGSKVIIEKLLSLGLDINSKTNSGETPLMLATKSRQAEAVNYLLSRGAK